MKIILLADLEGVSGVVDNEQQAKPGAPLYQEAREYLLSDVNAVIEGALDGGATEITIFDMHYYGLNLNLSKIHPQTWVFMGKPRKIYPLLKEVYQKADGFMMVGFHAMAQTPGGLLTHTYDHSIKSLYLNGILMGEIGMEAAIAGFYGVPLIFVAGDSKGTEETESLLGDIPTVTVKWAVNEHSALCLPIEVTHNEIRKTAKESLEKITEFKPYVLEPPYHIEVEFFLPEKAEKMEKLAGVTRIDELTVQAQGDDLPLLWEEFIGFCQNYQ